MGIAENKVKKLSGNVDCIYSAYNAFAALTRDGEVVTWGDAKRGGDCSDVSEALNGNIGTRSRTREYDRGTSTLSNTSEKDRTHAKFVDDQLAKRMEEQLAKSKAEEA